MELDDRLRWLGVALYAFGAVMLVGLPILMGFLWRDGFAWEPAQPEYEMMMMGIYMTLGVFLILAARDPLSNRGLIWFTVWSSIVHGGIMLFQALADESERANLLGDIPALFIVALVLGLLMPRRSQLADAST